MNVNIRKLYLYISAFIGLILIIIGTVQLVSLGLRTWILTAADDENVRYVCNEPRLEKPFSDATTTDELMTEEECEERKAEAKTARRQSDAARAISLVIVGSPVWFYHWAKVKDDKNN